MFRSLIRPPLCWAKNPKQRLSFFSANACEFPFKFGLQSFTRVCWSIFNPQIPKILLPQFGLPKAEPSNLVPSFKAIESDSVFDGLLMTSTMRKRKKKMNKHKWKKRRKRERMRTKKS
mmetsp:Transcript_15514/g.23110  ORF Transcript_15514/g.23110 Transcript_15514/m.23110 type:complete len:118 (-) Transcript_15514:53-406(-)